MHDYIITGGGPAGCVLAARLTEDPNVRVLLLEAGGRDLNPYIHMPVGFAKLTSGGVTWGYRTVPQRHLGNRAMLFAQGRVIGGGSSINAQVYTRGNAADYDGWAAAGCDGWTAADVLPYFKRAEDNERLCDTWHADGGPLGVSDPISPHPMSKVFIRAAQQAGHRYNPDFNGERQDGCGFYQVTQRHGRRSSAAVAYLHPARRRPNLTVRTGLQASRILLEKGRAVGVEAIDPRTRRVERFTAAREVLVTSGAIGSPKLLMLSGIGPADGLTRAGVTVTHDLPGVGRNLQDHLDLYVVSECSGPYSYDKHTRLDKTLWAGLQYLLFRQGPVTSNLAEAGGFAWADPSAPTPDIQFHFMLGSGIEAGLERLRNCGVTLNSAFLRPRSRGTVELASADPFAAPLIDPNYWADPYDRAMSIQGFRMAREIMRQSAFAPFIMAERFPGPTEESDEAIAAYAARTAKTDYHPVGTCKMGRDADAVVTPDLKVRGLDGLRVIDSSVMPLLVSSNTNAPTIMIGEKGADLVAGRTLPVVSSVSSARTLEDVS
ncbi:GMC family oxidoreductase [Azospirillum griseum]|uniref:FAD-binding protein n=1 Tax=Azospirillum griseum TaxID=2496639 RepID=A0A431VG63_9PROT|nr:GMC family oxidoreductase N-terminal domain-containing protein [Azospirillum griseum]RTR18845.1 FAD-binding protein [Azospirillum griseum]